MASASCAERPHSIAASRRSQETIASGGQAARRRSPFCAPNSRTIRLWRALFNRSVESRSNAAAGRCGRRAWRAARRTRVCPSRLAREPKGAWAKWAMRRERMYQRRCPVGTEVLRFGSDVPRRSRLGVRPHVRERVWPAPRKGGGTPVRRGGGGGGGKGTRNTPAGGLSRVGGGKKRPPPPQAGKTETPPPPPRPPPPPP